METVEIKKQRSMERLTAMCLTTLKPTKDKDGIYTAQIRVFDYLELALIIRNLMKLCILAVDSDSAEIPCTIKNPSIDVGLILGIALQLFPVNEFELLNEISILFPANSESKDDLYQK